MSRLIIFLSILAALASTEVKAQGDNSARYVSDIINVHLRRGPGSQFRIVRTLQTGARMEYVESAENGYEKVRLANGTEGFILSQYLTDTPSARSQLAALQEEIDYLKANQNPMQQQLTDLEDEKRGLEARMQQLREEFNVQSQELEYIKKVSANAIALETQNQDLRTGNQNLKNELEILRVDNQRLLESKDNDFFMYGAAAVLAGMIATLLIPRLSKTKRRSEWA